MFTEPPQISPVHAALLGGHHGGGFVPPHPQPGQQLPLHQGLPPGALIAMLLHGLAQHAQPFAGPGAAGGLGFQPHPLPGIHAEPGAMPGLRPPPVFQPPAQQAPAYGPVMQGGGGHPMPPQHGPMPLPRPAPGGIYGSPDQPPSRYPGPGPLAQPTLGSGPNQPAQPVPGPGPRPLPRYQPPIRRY